ncbi:DUF4138 domain-containing protein [Aquimarina sp. W85]|uniref:DUF4138 domain-containing protein n=1 Tax=Aquimarina rhodophyticola TaxID=3342246 RepID=UPI00366C71D2
MNHTILKFIVILCLGSSLYGQKHLIPLQKQDTLLVSDIKTTHLLFAKSIKYLDIGSPYFVADTIQQLLRLKHIGEELTDVRSKLSNLTVITDDGGYYSIVLGFNRFAEQVSYQVNPSEQIVEVFTRNQEFVEKKSNALESICEQLDKQDFNTRIKGGKAGDLKVAVSGIFYINEKIGIRLEFKNESTLDFDIDDILFRTKLRKRPAKDYLYQERVIPALFTCTDDREVIGHGQQTFTILFDKFMLNEKEKLAIDIFEKNGGRSVSLDIPRKKLLQPKII